MVALRGSLIEVPISNLPMPGSHGSDLSTNLPHVPLLVPDVQSLGTEAVLRKDEQVVLVGLVHHELSRRKHLDCPASRVVLLEDIPQLSPAHGLHVPPMNPD